MTTYFVDFLNGSDGANGLSFATRKKSLASVSGLLSAGDSVRIMGSGAPASLGNATWTNGSATVTLSSAANKTVTSCDSNWTASANVTCTTNTSTKKQGTGSQSIAFASGFTTGKAAYFTISSTDFSDQQILTFWLQTDTTIAPNTLRINLCSDTTGDTPVDSFTISTDLTVVGRWIPFSINKGSALGATIQSVALYTLLDPGTATVLLDDIITAPVGGLTLNSMISKNVTGETWYSTKSILGTTLIIEKSPTVTTVAKYGGTTESVTTYKLDTVYTDALVDSGTLQSISSSGTSGSYINVSGGWNTTDMSTQNGITWLDNRIGYTTGFNITGDYINIDKFYVTRANIGLRINASFITGNFSGNHNEDTGLYPSSGLGSSLTNIDGCFGNTYGIFCTATTISIVNIYNADANSFGIRMLGDVFNSSGQINARYNVTPISWVDGGGSLNSVLCNNNTDYSVFLNRGPLFINKYVAMNNTGYGLGLIGSEVKIGSLTTQGNSLGSVTLTPIGYKVRHTISNCSISEPTVLGGTFEDYEDSCVSFRALNDPEVHVNYLDGLTIKSNNSDRHTASGLAWEVDVTNTKRTSFYPGRFLLGPYPVNAGSAFSFSAWLKKSHASNISGRLIVYGGFLPGIDNNVEVSISGTSYTQHTISGMTPTEKGAIPVYLEVWSNTGSTTNYILIDDPEIEQV